MGGNFGFSQGFDLYLEPAPRNEPEGFKRPALGARRLQGTDQDLTLAAIEFMNQNRSRKFLLYAHYMDVHQYAYDDDAAALGFGASLSDSYDASIHWVDKNIYGLLLELDRLDLLKKTLVVVAADHGEAFREHGREGHATNIYREVTEVPLIMMLPFRLSEPLVVEPVVRNVDIWPTILDLAGLPPLPQTDGTSLVPLMEAAAKKEKFETPISMAYLDQTWGRVDTEPAPLISIRHDGQRILYRTRQPDMLESLRPGQRPQGAEEPAQEAARLGGAAQRRSSTASSRCRCPGERRTRWRSTTWRAASCRALGYVVAPGPPKKKD